MAALRRFASELTAQRTPGDILRYLCSNICEITNSELSAVAVIAETSGELRVECVTGLLASGDPASATDVSSSVEQLARHLRRQSPVTSHHGNHRGPSTLLCPQIEADGRSFLGVELKTQTRTYGILCLWRAIGSEHFTQTEEDRAAISAELAAIAYENSLQQQALQQLDSRLRTLTSEHMTEREQERHRISMAIHDDFGQDLTAIKIQLQLLGRQLPGAKSEVVERLSSIASSVDGLIHQVRRIATDLRLPVLDLGLIRGLRTHAQQFHARTGISCEVLADETIDLDPARAIAVFRVVQESLTNAARHSGATKVNVTLRATSERLMLQVEDNGRGFAHNFSEMSSLGILGMRERAAQLNGTLTISSRAKGGTTVTMNLPLI